MSTVNRFSLSMAGIIILVVTHRLLADEPVDYGRQIKPLLKERCYACHGALKQEANLRLDTAHLAKVGGDSGTALFPGKAAADSLILQRVSAPDVADRMPPEHEGEPLSPAQIDLVRRWIAEGAAAPQDEHPEADPRDHWAFRPIVRSVIPTVENARWTKNPIDAWVALKHQQTGVIPQSEASRITLLRRLSLDLIGLPPTREEILACLHDPVEDWYEKAVDRLLEDPRHGERWARHWMDNWRYSDWWGLGAQLRNSQQHIWHWRDWIVESLNKDASYAEMVRMMLAADELAPTDINQLRATGYLARNYYIFNRNRWLDETVEHVCKGFLGITMNCAKCHDHKYDPLDQADFYKLRAFFEPYQVRTDLIPGEADFNKDGIPRVFDGLPDAPTWKFIRGDESKPDQSHVILPGIPNVLELEPLKFETVPLPAVAWEPARREGVLETLVQASRTHLEQQETALVAARKTLQQAEQKQAALLAAESANGTSSPSSSFTLQEDFSRLDESQWQIVHGKWIHQPGSVTQNEDGPQQSSLRLVPQTPDDFEATIRFQISGGRRWRSVGLSFDTGPGASGEGHAAMDHQQLIYLSGAAEDSKIQGAFRESGKWTYPAQARKPFAVEMGKDYTMTVRVQGTLVNVSINGTPLLAWRLTVPRQPGSMQLSTYDALATFYEFTVAPLPHNASLQEPATTTVESANTTSAAEALVRKSRSKLLKAERAVTEAQAEFKSVQCRAAAMQTRWNDTDSELANEMRKAAIRAERELSVVKQQGVVTNAEEKFHALSAKSVDKKKAAEKELSSAREMLAKYSAALESEVQSAETFSPLAGARWSATRFQSTAKDDPEVAFPQQSTGRRTALANWITDRRNPLTARVAVNHIWGRHFGEPLVATTFDFGRNGARPTHPELLDWLACEFMDHGWSMKHLHRLIVTSATYRMDSTLAGAERSAGKDPENRTLWRRVPIRLESQVVRDALLSLAGTLDPVMGGPPVAPLDQATSQRRSLYFFHSNNERNLFLSTFDEAMVSECYRREQSIVPQQALALSNSGLVLDAARQIADRISAESENDQGFVRNTFLILTGINANEAEIAASLKALESWQQLPEGTVVQARINFVWSLINHNDFVTLR